MTHTEIIAIKAKMADLKNSPETSGALRAYLDESLWRDPVDVLNEIEVLARLLRNETGALANQSLVEGER